MKFPLGESPSKYLLKPDYNLPQWKKTSLFISVSAVRIMRPGMEQDSQCCWLDGQVENFERRAPGQGIRGAGAGLVNIIYCYFAASHLTSSLSLFGCQMELRRPDSRIVLEQPEEANESQIHRSL